MTLRTCLAAAALLAGLAPTSAAAAREHVAMICDSRLDPLCPRLLAELTSAGHQVDVLPPLTDLNQELAAPGAVVQVQRSPRSVLIWFRKQGVVEARVVSPVAGERDPDRLLVVQVAEGVRAAFIAAEVPPEAGPGPEPAPDPPATESPPVPAPQDAPTAPAAGAVPSDLVGLQDERPAPPRFSFAVAPGIAWSPGGAGPLATLALDAAWRVGSVAGLHLLVGVPLTGSEVQAVEGRGDLYPFLGGVAASARLEGEQFNFEGAAGLAALVLHALGTAQGGLVSTQETAATAMPFASLTVGYAVRSTVRIRLGLVSGIALPQPVVAFAGRKVAAFGWPLLIGTLGIEFLLP